MFAWMDVQLRAILERLNPWLVAGDDHRAHSARFLPDPFVERATAPALTGALRGSRRAHLVVGPRQAGKSTLVWSVLARDERPVLLVNCEEPLVREWCRSPALFAADLEHWLPAGGVLFLEEAQWLDEAGLFLKGLVDLRTGRTIVVTGSASFHLLSRTRESLAGRATRHHVWPLTLSEVAPPRANLPPAANLAAARRALERLLLYGGYPDAWTSEDPVSVLRELVTAFVLRDASDRLRIGRPDAFRLVLRLAATQPGDLVNLSEWGSVAGVATSTVADYASLLEETHVIRLVRPFIGGKRAELTRSPKVFFLDNGLRNAVAGGFEPLDARADIGRLLENFVFSELHKRSPEPGEVRFWRTRNKAEVDFVIQPRPDRLVAIEVKSQARGRPRLTRALRSFVDAYEPELVLMVYRGEPFEDELGGTRVLGVPAERLTEVLDATAC
jgi:predicted AAA+ superfamily ATPase